MPPSPPSRSDAAFTRLERRHLGDDPLGAFTGWLAHAERHSTLEYPNACTLSTVDERGMPEGRIILLKGVAAEGFVFFTNYRSTKAKALEAGGRAALTFYWDDLARQVRVRGITERVSEAESDAYFASRPRLSRLGAWASRQSEPLESREVLESRLEEMRTRFGSGEVPRPPHWGGYLLRPVEIEFWAAGDARLHDRFRFRRPDPEGEWEVDRLNP